MQVETFKNVTIVQNFKKMFRIKFSDTVVNNACSTFDFNEQRKISMIWHRITDFQEF